MSDWMRIDKFLSQMQAGSRKEIKELVKKGRIKVNGSVITNANLKVNTQTDVVSIDEQKIEFVKYEYFIMNKPQGVVSATKDGRDPTVLSLITDNHDNKRNDLFPVGRLDKDTEGLIMITNDGELAHRLLSPSKHVSKTYYAKIDGIVTDEDIARFSKGFLLLDGTLTKSAELSILSVSEEENMCEIEVTLYEGKYHQVKRMFAACGKHVAYLKRIAMGGLKLDDNLKAGQYRKMTDEELELISEHDR